MREWLVVGLIFAALTAVVTWPQPAHVLTHAHAHHDALFSMWRLSWIADALTTQPSRLFDPPIFHPEPRTLAFSDAVLLQGLIGTPWLAAGVPVLPVYNVLLLAGPWASCLGMYLLLRSLLRRMVETGENAAGGWRPAASVAGGLSWPAIVGGTIFGLLPYRIEHVMHLELQWSQWMPLACWALHRTVWFGRVRDGVLTALFVLAQFLSCIYYGVFLVMVLGLAAPVLLFTRSRASLARVCGALAVGAMVSAGPLIAYAAPYRASQARLGGRTAAEIATWSATPGSFVSAPQDNRLYGATARFGGPEGRLMPGITATVLAVIGIWVTWRQRAGQMYLIALLASSVLALGTHSPAYRLALALLPPLQGLRAPGRFGMVVALALAVLAGVGAARLLSRLPHGRRRHLAGAAVVGLLALEYASSVGPLHAWPMRAPLYTLWLRGQPPGVVADLPMPRADAVPLHEAEWSFYARFHGRPLANGYSGYYPPNYIFMLGVMRRFPDADSLEVLRARQVRYLVVHEDRYEPADLLALDTRLRAMPGVRPAGRIPDPAFPVLLYTLDPH